MREIWPRLKPWIEQAHPFVLATLVAAEGSSPRAVGAVLAVRPEGRHPHFVGGVSSGCVENDLLERASAVLHENAVEEHLFGPEKVLPWATGLTCGGTIRVRLERYFAFSPDPVMREIATVWHRFLDEDEPGVLLSSGARHLLLMNDGSILGTRADWPPELLEASLGELREGSAQGRLATDGGAGVFLRFNRPRPRLILVGAVEIAVELASLAASLPVRLTVVDPREGYLTPERFAGTTAERVVAWPQEYLRAHPLEGRDMVIALSHDAKIDDPALVAALANPCGRVAALGSRQSQERRRERLREAGVPEGQLQRLIGPVGLWHGGRDAQSIALSILAQWRAGSPVA